jgi:enediyne biosynthesis protein E4
VEPGFFPEIPSSTLLRNDHGKFIDVTDSVAPGLRKLGMVTSALWTDIDNDHKPDLLVVGEWMPISIFKNSGGKLINVTDQSALSNSQGWWQSIQGGDFDNDGDMDYVIGNWGLNSPYTASVENPMTVCYKDFDKDGNIDAILSYHEEGVDYPAHAWDNMVLQMPGIRKKIPNYHTFSGTTTDKLLGILDTSGMKKSYCRTLQSVYLENLGNGKFQLHNLPIRAQFAPIFGMMAEDLNHDGNLDLVTIGNFYGTEVVIGRYDASIGLTLFGNGKGGFTPVSVKESGVCVYGDAKALSRIESVGNKSLVLASQNGDSLKIFSDNTDTGFERLKIEKQEMAAVIHFKNGTSRKNEFYYGNGYLSQSSRTLVITPDISRIELYTGNGKLTRSLKFNGN